jgi:hypothetical protein
MKMRSKAFILSIILLAGLAVYFFLLRNNTTLNPYASDFSLSDPEKVTKISITDNGGTISLVKTAEGWKTGEVTAIQHKVEDLLILMHLVETGSPASIEFASEINACIDEGINIICYQDKKVIISFYLCKFNRALYARKQGNRKAYRISVRGYGNTDLTAIITSRLQAWQQNVIIDLAPKEIKLVSIHYPGTSKNGFSLIVDSTGNPYLFDEEGRLIEQTLKHQRTKDYFYSFSGIRYYDVKKEFPDKTFLKNEKPFCELKIAARDSSIISIKGYRITDPETGESNSAEFYTVHPEFGLILLKYSDFDPILVERDYFLKN